MILRPSPVSTDQFTWVKDERMLVAEASSLPPFGPVFDDSCDEGMTLTSHHTGLVVVYAVVGEHRPDDLLWWDLKPVWPHADFPPVRVFND